MLASRSALAAATWAGVPWSRTTSLPESASEKRTTMPPCLAVSSWILLPFGPIRPGKSLRSTASSSLTRLAFASGTVERARQGPSAHGHEIVGVPSYQLLEQGADLLLSGGRVGRRAAQLRDGRAVLRLGHLEARRRRQQNVADLHSSGQTRDAVTVRGGRAFAAMGQDGRARARGMYLGRLAASLDQDGVALSRLEGQHQRRVLRDLRLLPQTS